jgi:hypothetical protein
MVTEKNQPTNPVKVSIYNVGGQIQREQSECQPGELKLAAYVFDKAGVLIGSADLDNKGNYSVLVRLTQPADVELVIGPVGDAQQIRHSSAYSKKFSAKEWKTEGRQFDLRHDVVLPLEIWRPWWPLRICISGHVRKVSHHDGITDICPVPYVKVEIFDVDREPCWWPWFRKWWEVLLDRPVFRIPDLLKEPRIPPKPFPGPDPIPDLNLGQIANPGRNVGTSSLEKISLNPQPLPPCAASTTITQSLSNSWLNPQPEPPIPVTLQQSAFMRVGEARLMDSSIAARLDKLTLTSKIAPWHIFSKCFYSKVEVCETSTDCKGFFNCCFSWYPFHFRNGRLRYDSRPDIIIKVTQVINGVSTVIYMDPYTSTRWNVTNTHIDLYLDNEEVVCGTGDCGERPEGSPVFFTRIGDDEVDKINQTSGLYNEAPLSNVAYGGSLLVYGQFGDALSTGVPARYYRLSYARQGSSEFTPLVAPLGDTRVAKSTLSKETHTLGPITVNGVPALYEVRNFSDYYWFNPDWLGTWHSWLTEEDTGKYVLRLEVFDQNGVKLTSAMGVDYRDGTVAPPAVLPPMLDSCDLVITLDNKAPEVDLTIPAVMNECGVILWSAVPLLNLNISVLQENGRLYAWGLQYNKGVNPAIHVLDSGTSNTGLPATVNKTVDATIAPTGINMLSGVTTTCAFALKLWATAHVRDGRNFIFYREQIKAIAVEKCPSCPPCP